MANACSCGSLNIPRGSWGQTRGYLFPVTSNGQKGTYSLLSHTYSFLICMKMIKSGLLRLDPSNPTRSNQNTFIFMRCPHPMGLNWRFCSSSVQFSFKTFVVHISHPPNPVVVVVVLVTLVIKPIEFTSTQSDEPRVAVWPPFNSSLLPRPGKAPSPFLHTPALHAFCNLEFR